MNSLNPLSSCFKRRVFQHISAGRESGLNAPSSPYPSPDPSPPPPTPAPSPPLTPGGRPTVTNFGHSGAFCASPGISPASAISGGQPCPRDTSDSLIQTKNLYSSCKRTICRLEALWPLVSSPRRLCKSASPAKKHGNSVQRSAALFQSQRGGIVGMPRDFVFRQCWTLRTG